MNSCGSQQDEKCGSSTCCSKLVAVVGALLIFAALVWAAKKYTTPPVIGAERAAERAKARAELTAAEAEALDTVGYIDSAKGIVRLPISAALVVAEKQWQDPAKARAELLVRVEKANFVPPKPPEKPSALE